MHFKLKMAKKSLGVGLIEEKLKRNLFERRNSIPDRHPEGVKAKFDFVVTCKGS